jgi:hypothetical protein
VQALVQGRICCEPGLDFFKQYILRPAPIKLLKRKRMKGFGVHIANREKVDSHDIELQQEQSPLLLLAEGIRFILRRFRNGACKGTIHASARNDQLDREFAGRNLRAVSEESPLYAEQLC